MRLGLDIGTSSIGWWLYATDDTGITGVIDGGVRIFSDGRVAKSGASLAVDRRAARAARRRRDRYLRRRASLMRKMAAVGLMPAAPEDAKALELLDPYELRAKALDEPLPLTHLGRVFFHLNQRRGFKSNRKTDRGDNESGKIKEATARLDRAMLAAGARTYGEFLHLRRSAEKDARRVPSVRTRLTLIEEDGGDGAETGYDFYPDRRHLEEEFDRVWRAQAPFHPEVLTDALRATLFETVFYQRPLTAPKPGLCLFTDEERLPKAHPLSQRRVLYETVNALRIVSHGRARRALTVEQRDAVVHALDNKKPDRSPPKSATKGPSLKLTHIAKKILKLDAGEGFSLETEMRDAIACDPVRAAMSHPARFGPSWSTLDEAAQWDIVKAVAAVQSDDDFAALVAWLEDEHGLDEARARQVASAPLPEGYARVGETATRRILAELRADVVTYSQAVAACGWHHSDFRTGEVWDRLPYYGQVLERHVIPGSGDAVRHDPETQAAEFHGRLTNPTVHIGLNQLRRLVNRLIEVHGKPDEIVVEVARELKQSLAQKQETIRNNKENREAAERRSQKLIELGQPDTGANRLLLRLYEDLGPAIGPRCCPYTGTPIDEIMLFDGRCEVDHILPYSRTLDDGVANRTLCLRTANREKRNKTPWEAWGDTPAWDTVEANLKNLPPNKRWRFAPDAMERYEGERDFLDRALVDTQYLARLARTYLDVLYDGADGKSHVWVVTGRQTEMLRRHWGLNRLLSDREAGAGKAKNRADHRHHAIDAAVIGATDPGLVQRVADAAARDEENGLSAEAVVRAVPEPWDGFRADIAARLDRMIVSHRADHGRFDPIAKRLGRDSTAARLHNDTAYGIVDDQRVVSRVPLLSLKPGDLDDGARGKLVRDPDLRRALARATEGKIGKDFERALRDFAGRDGPYRGIRRVRVIEPLQRAVRVEVAGGDGRPYKAYKGGSNHCLEVWRLPDGKIEGVAVTAWEAHNPDRAKGRHPAAKRLLRLHKNDMVAIERAGQTVICYVQKTDPANGAFLVPHAEANADARNRDRNDPFKFFQMSPASLVKAGARRVHVDELGRVRGGAPPQER